MAVRTFGGTGARARWARSSTTDEDGERALFWIAPHGGGTRLAEGAVQVVTPKSPLGRALLGANAGDECEVPRAGKPRVLGIVSVT